MNLPLHCQLVRASSNASKRRVRECTKQRCAYENHLHKTILDFSSIGSRVGVVYALPAEANLGILLRYMHACILTA
ncbi:hypothetical protein M3J09_006741 [Ascochyta lentis]